MPLDPQARAILDMLAALNLPPFTELTPEEARRQAEQSRVMPPGEPVASVEDVEIPVDGRVISARVYRPQAEGTLPVLLYFHGGGWVIGSIDSHDAVCRALANRAGCAVVSVGYRLAPEHKFPVPAEDAYASLLWLRENAARLDVDTERIAIGGDSAGGNLAAAVAVMTRDRGGPAIAFQLLVYPVTDYNFDTASYGDNAEGYLLTRDSMRWFWDHYLRTPEDGANPYASPLRAADLRGLPPAWIITAEFDPLRDEGDAYSARLREAGVDVTHACYDGMIHGFFGMGLFIDRAKEAVDAAGAALKAAFAREPVAG